MQISMIAAIGQNREIGLDNQLLWKLPDDMKFFRQHTLGKPILVARKTWESFGAKPLPGRRNVVLTRDTAYLAEGAEVVHSIDSALKLLEGEAEIMVIGGANLYEQLLPLSHNLYLTQVLSAFDADSFFPKLDLSQWREISREHHDIDERHEFAFDFVIMERQS